MVVVVEVVVVVVVVASIVKATDCDITRCYHVLLNDNKGFDIIEELK